MLRPYDGEPGAYGSAAYAAATLTAGIIVPNFALIAVIQVFATIA
jgi:hypothetical protein